MRIGLGFDAHRFAEGRQLVLAGCEIPSEVGLVGHSDADVASHAIADALLGAAALGDLGEHFPNDERWSDASSLDILREVASLLARAGYKIANVDVTIVGEGPRLAPHRDAMVGALASALGISEEAVSVKATTSDEMGFTGRGEGLAALATALIEARA